MDRQKDTGVEAFLEQLIEHGPNDIAGVFVRAFDLAMRIERERFLDAGHYERTGLLQQCPWLLSWVQALPVPIYITFGGRGFLQRLSRISLFPQSFFYVIITPHNPGLSLMDLVSRAVDHSLRQLLGQMPIGKAALFAFVGHGANIGARPGENVHLARDDPRALIIKAKVLSDLGGYIDGWRIFVGRRVSDCRHNNGWRIGTLLLSGKHDGARAVFAAFFLTAPFFIMPKVAVTYDALRRFEPLPRDEYAALPLSNALLITARDLRPRVDQYDMAVVRK